MRPALIAMCGLPFSGKSVLARSLGQSLGIRVLSYDFEIYQAFRHLTAGGRLIYDDLLLERDDRRKLAAACRAELVLVYLDTQRR
jgi:predicted kinase